MAAPPGDIPVLRFSTDDVSARDRVAMIREVHGRLTARCDLEPAPRAPPYYEATARVLPGLIVSSLSHSPITVGRTRELLADGKDDVVLVVSPTAGSVVAHLGRELSPGAGVLLSSENVLRVHVATTLQCLFLTLSRRTLAPLVTGLEDAFMRPVPRDTEALQLLARYVRLLEDQHSLATPELRHLVVNHVHDLVALALGATRDAAALAHSRGVHAARLHAIKTEILANLDSLNRPRLSLDRLAARHGVSPRHVQMLFESDGTTFSRFLLDQRLARAHRMLGDPRMAERTITAIAFDAGFGDLSHFNRVFRRQYGETPSDVRAGSKQSDSR